MQQYLERCTGRFGHIFLLCLQQFDGCIYFGGYGSFQLLGMIGNWYFYFVLIWGCLYQTLDIGYQTCDFLGVEMDNFKGTKYRLADNWFEFVPVEQYKNRPINYLEIGAYYGGNIISVAETYGNHPASRLYCIDPWEDYADYQEYVGQQDGIYETFINNVWKSGNEEKITDYRGYSHIELPKFPSNFFDIIYIDGNHNPEYVLEDAVLSFRKLLPGGILIFDDYNWGNAATYKLAVDSFLACYAKKITYLGEKNTQVFIRKT